MQNLSRKSLLRKSNDILELQKVNPYVSVWYVAIMHLNIFLVSLLFQAEIDYCFLDLIFIIAMSKENFIPF